MLTFAAMNVSEVALNMFNVEQLREEQIEVISAILRSENVIAVLPTGFGKSLCYQISTVMMQGFTIVVTPLLALCEDQMEYMQSHGVTVDRMDSTLLRDQQAAVCGRIRQVNSGLKALYTTPETLQHNVLLAKALHEATQAGNISFITIDEAHCVLDWSEFRYECILRSFVCVSSTRCTLQVDVTTSPHTQCVLQAGVLSTP